MERSDRWLSVTLRTVLLGLFFWMVKGILVPIIVGALFALLLYPIQRWLAPKLGRFRGAAPSLLTVSALILVVIPFAFIGIEVFASIQRFATDGWSGTVERLQGFSARWLQGITDRFGISIDNVREYLGNLARQVGSSVASYAGTMASALPESIVDVFLFAVALYFFLRDGKALTRWMYRLSPFNQNETEELFTSIHDTVFGAILGLLATSLVQGTLTTIALFIFKIPGAFLFGVIATLLSFIPMIGTTPVTIGAMIFLFASGRFGAGIGMGIAAALIGLSDNVVRPWVQSSHGGMHPLIALLGIFGGLEVFGPAGVFIGPVIAAMAIWTVDTYASLRLKQVKMSSIPPPRLSTPP